MGSGLRVLNGLHVKNGCAWINHSESPKLRRRLFELVKEHPCVKAWFSGHFHLGQDYEDSISIPRQPLEGQDDGFSGVGAGEAGEGKQAVGVGSCVFVQTGVIGTSSSRDRRRQSRLLKGYEKGLQIFTVNHHKGGELRLDATVTTGGVDDLYYPCNGSGDNQEPLVLAAVVTRASPTPTDIRYHRLPTTTTRTRV